MAETKKGKKMVYVHQYTRKTSNGGKVVVPAHFRSTPN